MKVEDFQRYHWQTGIAAHGRLFIEHDWREYVTGFVTTRLPWLLRLSYSLALSPTSRSLLKRVGILNTIEISSGGVIFLIIITLFHYFIPVILNFIPIFFVYLIVKLCFIVLLSCYNVFRS